MNHAHVNAELAEIDSIISDQDTAASSEPLIKHTKQTNNPTPNHSPISLTPLEILMALIHNLGYPRIGNQRQLKKAVEAYWKGSINEDDLQQIGSQLRAEHWQIQADAGIELIPVGDFSWYDQILDMTTLLGAIPPRFQIGANLSAIDTYFLMARGQVSANGETHNAAASEMTKWFDTNYHYMVPEFYPAQSFKLNASKLIDEIKQAQQLGHRIKPVIVGPLTYLWLGKNKHGQGDKLALLEQLIPVYQELFEQLGQCGIEWLQIDEPILTLDLPSNWLSAFQSTYQSLQTNDFKVLLTTYFGDLEDNLNVAIELPVDGLHIDIVQASQQLTPTLQQLPSNKILSVGIVDGRNIWRNSLSLSYEALSAVQTQIGDRLWVAPSCSLLHVPCDVEQETLIDPEQLSWLAFARQKLTELRILGDGLNHGRNAIQTDLNESDQIIENRRRSPRIHNLAVQTRMSELTDAMAQRGTPYSERIEQQNRWLDLPLYPTTTIGSFPQTNEIRAARKRYKTGDITEAVYNQFLKDEIAHCVEKQHEIGLDVLVHGEAERNDMVEYFGEKLDGFLFSAFGWVQSYGSRCVKPPIIYGDVSRPKPMTVEWSQYAQSLTDKPMKGMLTGPVTILNWSFVRNDQARGQTCTQIALALRDEVQDLESAGIKTIQIDEAALREGLPLRRSDWQHYLDWAVRAFRITSSGIADDTQIHTHMCYSEFNDIIEAVAAMDADVITIETSRSDMKLLDVFKRYEYPNQIGPGVYDIHSPSVPERQQMVELMKNAQQRIAAERLWVNPDCGLKTRGWPEVTEALITMVAAAKELRSAH